VSLYILSLWTEAEARHSGVEAGELCTKRSLDSLEHITSIAAGWEDAHPDDLEGLLAEVREHDTAIRQDVGLIIDIKVGSGGLHTKS
jgi:hypothetical protein